MVSIAEAQKLVDKRLPVGLIEIQPGTFVPVGNEAYGIDITRNRRGEYGFRSIPKMTVVESAVPRPVTEIG